MSLSALLFYDEKRIAAYLSPIFRLFEKIMISDGPAFQPASLFVFLSGKLNANGHENDRDYKYDDWDWKELQGSVYVDQLKAQQPDLKHIFIFQDYETTVNRLLERDFHSIDAANQHKGYLSNLFWKYFKKRHALQRFYNSNASEYFKFWLKCNIDIAAQIKKLPRDSYVFLDRKMLNTCDARVSAYLLKNWNVSLKYLRFKSLGSPAIHASQIDIDVFFPAVAETSATKGRG